MDWRYKHTVLALCTLAFFSTMVARLSVSPVVPAITADFEISNTVIGFALTGMWMAYALAQFPSGILGDRFGERSIILLSVGGTTLMSVLLALAPRFGVFVISVVALGAVAGLHYSVATTLLGRTFDNLGFAIGVHTSGSSAAGLIAPVAAAWIGVQFGWRPAVAFAAAIAAPIFVAFAWRVRPTEPRRPDQPIQERIRMGPLATILARPEIAFTVAIAALCAFVWQGTASFLPAFLVEHRGQSSTLAGVVFGLYFVVQSVAKPGVGALSDRYGRDIVIGGCMVTSVTGLGLFISVPGLVGVVGGVVLVGVGLTWAVAVEPRFIDNLSANERGGGFGLVRTVYLLIGSLGSVAVGLFADAFGWAVSFGMLMLLLALVAVGLTINWTLGLEY
jgi:MFS transporter, YNFM family, putative membrane transport protein